MGPSRNFAVRWLRPVCVTYIYRHFVLPRAGPGAPYPPGVPPLPTHALLPRLQAPPAAPLTLVMEAILNVCFPPAAPTAGERLVQLMTRGTGQTLPAARLKTHCT